MKRAIVAVVFAAVATAAAPAGKGPVQRINPADLSKPAGTPPAYTHVVVATGARTIYVSGQLPVDKDGKLVGEGDFTAQAKQVFENLKVGLAAAGATFAEVVKITVYLTDASQLDAYRQVRAQYTGAEPPASSGVIVAGLLRKGALLEVDVVAVTAR